MKENLKKILFIISIFYSLVIVVLMTITMTKLTTEIELYDDEENLNKLESYKEELLSLEENDCTKSISEIITYYEDTSYNGITNLKDMYNSDKNILNYYVPVKDSCNLTEEMIDKYNLPTKFVTASIQNDELYQPYLFQYELSIKDNNARSIIEPSLSVMEYRINRSLILEIIKALIDSSKGGN